jgi:LysR family transcriptional regulator, carnitine catabolism transcriptional activator
MLASSGRLFAGLRRVRLFRFSLMVIRAGNGNQSRGVTSTWSALKGEKLISLPPSIPLQQLVDRQLAKAGVAYKPNLTANYLNTQIAMVEAGQGVAIIPSYGLPACRSRKLPPVAEDFTSFLQSYIASWAGRSGIL